MGSALDEIIWCLQRDLDLEERWDEDLIRTLPGTDKFYQEQIRIHAGYELMGKWWRSFWD